ncbi:MAG: DUF2726 domain-containing protein [Burkholderiales bacterium]|nr:DUF2726 domain-containing protein [Burkholderiales bacterium]
MLLIVSLTAVPVAIVIFLIWSYRKKVAHKTVASQERYSQLFSASQPDATAGGEAASTPVSAVRWPADAPGYAIKERLLSKAETLLFYVLRAGLPGHEIFSRLNLDAVVDTPPALQDYERELIRRRLAQHCLDFVVCDKTMKIVAAVEFEADTEVASFKAACLESAGIRHIRVNVAAIPRREEIHFLVYGTHPRQDS